MAKTEIPINLGTLSHMAQGAELWNCTQVPSDSGDAEVQIASIPTVRRYLDANGNDMYGYVHDGYDSLIDCQQVFNWIVILGETATGTGTDAGVQRMVKAIKVSGDGAGVSSEIRFVPYIEKLSGITYPFKTFPFIDKNAVKWVVILTYDNVEGKVKAYAFREDSDFRTCKEWVQESPEKNNLDGTVTPAVTAPILNITQAFRFNANGRQSPLIAPIDFAYADRVSAIYEIFIRSQFYEIYENLDPDTIDAPQILDLSSVSTSIGVDGKCVCNNFNDALTYLSLVSPDMILNDQGGYFGWPVKQMALNFFNPSNSGSTATSLIAPYVVATCYNSPTNIFTDNATSAMKQMTWYWLEGMNMLYQFGSVCSNVNQFSTVPSLRYLRHNNAGQFEAAFLRDLRAVYLANNYNPTLAQINTVMNKWSPYITNTVFSNDPALDTTQYSERLKIRIYTGAESTSNKFNLDWWAYFWSYMLNWARSSAQIGSGPATPTPANLVAEQSEFALPQIGLTMGGAKFAIINQGAPDFTGQEDADNSTIAFASSYATLYILQHAAAMTLPAGWAPTSRLCFLVNGSEANVDLGNFCQQWANGGSYTPTVAKVSIASGTPLFSSTYPSGATAASRPINFGSFNPLFSSRFAVSGYAAWYIPEFRLDNTYFGNVDGTGLGQQLGIAGIGITSSGLDYENRTFRSGVPSAQADQGSIFWGSYGAQSIQLGYNRSPAGFPKYYKIFLGIETVERNAQTFQVTPSVTQNAFPISQSGYARVSTLFQIAQGQLMNLAMTASAGIQAIRSNVLSIYSSIQAALNSSITEDSSLNDPEIVAIVTELQGMLRLMNVFTYKNSNYNLGQPAGIMALLYQKFQAFTAGAQVTGFDNWTPAPGDNDNLAKFKRFMQMYWWVMRNAIAYAMPTGTQSTATPAGWVYPSDTRDYSIDIDYVLSNSAYRDIVASLGSDVKGSDDILNNPEVESILPLRAVWNYLRIKTKRLRELIKKYKAQKAFYDIDSLSHRLLLVADDDCFYYSGAGDRVVSEINFYTPEYSNSSSQSVNVLGNRIVLGTNNSIEFWDITNNSNDPFSPAYASNVYNMQMLQWSECRYDDKLYFLARPNEGTVYSYYCVDKTGRMEKISYPTLDAWTSEYIKTSLATYDPPGKNQNRYLKAASFQFNSTPMICWQFNNPSFEQSSTNESILGQCLCYNVLYKTWFTLPTMLFRANLESGIAAHPLVFFERFTNRIGTLTNFLDKNDKLIFSYFTIPNSNFKEYITEKNRHRTLARITVDADLHNRETISQRNAQFPPVDVYKPVPPAIGGHTDQLSDVWGTTGPYWRDTEKIGPVQEWNTPFPADDPWAIVLAPAGAYQSVKHKLRSVKKMKYETSREIILAPMQGDRNVIYSIEGLCESVDVSLRTEWNGYMRFNGMYFELE